MFYDPFVVSILLIGSMHSTLDRSHLDRIFVLGLSVVCCLSLVQSIPAKARRNFLAARSNKPHLHPATSSRDDDNSLAFINPHQQQPCLPSAQNSKPKHPPSAFPNLVVEFP